MSQDKIPNPYYRAEEAVLRGTGDGVAVGAAGTVGAAVGTLVIGGLRSQALLPWPPGQLDLVATGLVATAAGAVVAIGKRVWRNVKKHKYLQVFLVLLCLGALGGCKTTTGPDGVVVQELDVRGIEETWRRLGLKWKEPPPEGAGPVVIEVPELPPVEVTVTP